jgi:putative ABC transport system permease protein
MRALLQIKDEIIRSLAVGWFLAWRQIRRSGKGTTVLIIFIMTLTFLNLVVVSGLLVGLISGSYKQFRESYAGDVIITSAPGHDYIQNSPALLDFLESHPRVVAISPRHGAGAIVLGTPTIAPQKNERPNQISARVSGIDPQREEVISRFSRFVVHGAMLEDGDTSSILVGANLIKKYSSFADANVPGLDLLRDVDIGDRIRVTIASANDSALGTEEAQSASSKFFYIKGIVKSKVDEISTRMFILDSELKRLIPVNKEQVQEIAIKTEPGYAPTLVSEAKAYMGNYLARIQTADEAIPSFLRDIETTMSILGNALSSFALIVASITVFIVIYINAVTKRKFIGILKAIGISPLAIEASYLVQAFFYGAAGSAIGLLITFGFLKPYFDANPIDFPFSDGILAATSEGAMLRVAILLGVTILAGFIPAKLIVSKNTLDSILGR